MAGEGWGGQGKKGKKDAQQRWGVIIRTSLTGVCDPKVSGKEGLLPGVARKKEEICTNDYLRSAASKSCFVTGEWVVVGSHAGRSRFKSS